MNVRNLDILNAVENIHSHLEKVLHFSGQSNNVDFFISSLTEYNPFNTTEEIEKWLEDMNKKEYFQVDQIPLSELRKWKFDPWSGDLCHESGGFFNIRGLEVRTNVGVIKEWTQPIIDQPEIGVLGILTRKINDILYFLMQAKAEPGNINTFQLSPTVQATRSNYLQFHGGKPTKYLEYFLEKGLSETLVDQLHSEQGARFFHKRNRNMIVRIPDDREIELEYNWRWMTLGQIKRLMLKNNTVNMDSRSVISNISYDPENKNSLASINANDLRDCLENTPLTIRPVSDFRINAMVSSHGNTPTVKTVDEFFRNLSQDKFDCMLNTRLIPLNEVRYWHRTPYEITHNEGRYFSVIGVRIKTKSREVTSWDQPIIRQVDPGIVSFIVHAINGVLHFLVQLKMESGNMDLLELAPTVQCITGSYVNRNEPPYVEDIINAHNGEIIFDTMQSEEGGRFYREENRNVLVFKNGTSEIKDFPRYYWMTLSQLKLFLKLSNFLNVESRSLLAMI